MNTLTVHPFQTELPPHHSLNQIRRSLQVRPRVRLPDPDSGPALLFQ